MSRRQFPLPLPGALLLAIAALLSPSVPGAHAQAPSAASAVPGSLQAAAAAIAQTAQITQAVDDGVLVSLKGNVHPLAKAQYDRGAASASMPTGRLSLLLPPNPVQHQALREYLDSLQDPKSPNYHQWLTPASFAATYGASPADIATVSAWLSSKGFKVEKVATAHNIIQFSGTVGQITTAFHTPIHRFVVNGEQHYANTAEPQIPAALATVVKAISPLNDFHPRPSSHIGAREAWSPAANAFVPNFNLFDSNNNPTLFVDPADAATIYNTPNATLNKAYSGTTYDGTGVTVGIAGDSNYTQQDVANYRALFLNDTNAAHLPTVIVDGDDPGINGDAGESLLDVEILGGIAPGAKINFYTSENTFLSSGLDLAVQRAVQDNTVSILNVSFGVCEAQASGDLQFYNLIWEQAAAQGITGTVSTGDSGAAGCDASNATAASQGLAVNALASTPYDVAVGGTDYLLTSANFGNYVTYKSGANFTSGAPPYYGTALGYIPETPWNDSINSYGSLSQNTALLLSGATNISGAGGGVSLQYAKPAFQAALTPADKARDLPDVSLLAANGLNGALWAYCSDNVANGDSTQTYTDCQLTNGAATNTTSVSGVGGTSTAAPAFAGMLALVTQSLGSGVRLGQANDTLYRLANTAYSTVFHDVTQGNNSVPCTQGTPNCAADAAGAYFLTGYNAGTGYDLASGLGSVNVAQMVAKWPTAGLTSSTVSLTANSSTNPITLTHGQNVSFTVGVNPSAATGGVSINTTSGLEDNGNINISTASLANGTVTFPLNTLPGGSYNLYAYYGGDTNYAGAASNTIAVTVGKEDSISTLTFDVADLRTNTTITGTTFPYGSYAFADVYTYGKAAVSIGGNPPYDGYPTGSVSVAGFSSTPLTANYNSTGTASLPFTTASPGTYNITASFAGDASFNPSSASGSLTITKASSVMQAANSANVLAAGASATVTVLVGADSVGTPPSGPITLTGNGQTFAAATTQQGYADNGLVAAEEATFTVPASMLAAGVNTLTASYAGDVNYTSATTTTQITVTATPSFSLAGPTTGLNITAGSAGTATIAVAPVNGFTGAVGLTCSVSSGGGTTPTCALNPTSVTLAGAAVNTTLTVTTSTTSTVNYPLGRFFAAGGGVALGCVLLFGIPARRRSWQKMLALLCLLVGLGSVGLMGCGGSSGSGGGSGPTAPRTYNVTVTGTASGNTVSTATVTVTVQ